MLNLIEKKKIFVQKLLQIIYESLRIYAYIWKSYLLDKSIYSPLENFQKFLTLA